MHRLRTSSSWARLVLAWFALTLGVAIASPIVAPRATELVCSDGGSMKLVSFDRDGNAVTTGQHTLDCAQCLPVFLPAPPVLLDLPQAGPIGRSLARVEQARTAALVGAPLPPRGPPSLS